MNPTKEQEVALTLFSDGHNLAIEAGAGTGKTSTLILMAQSEPEWLGTYVAFNKAIVVEAQMKMPGNVEASTAHSLAMRAVGHQYRHRLNSGRMRSAEIARTLRIEPLTVTYGSQKKVLQRNYLAGQAMKAITIFCQSADEQPGPQHVAYIDGIDVPDDQGQRTDDNNRIVREHLSQYLAKAWADISNRDGTLPFKHDHYLKLWERRDPRISGDFILFDEAQDAAPVMLSAVTQQSRHGAQLVFVGDSQQQIYEWRGAVNALASIDTKSKGYLTKSWRFGPAIAEIANVILADLDAELRLEGNEAIPSLVEDAPVAKPEAILCRTNARAVSEVLARQAMKERPHLVGGSGEVLAFARAAVELQSTGSTWYPDLACFTGWGEVQEYVANDPQGSELKLLVELVDEYGARSIEAALDPARMPDEDNASVVISTAHKAKGREWKTVQISHDFPGAMDMGPGELRLLYVACTRARNLLDISKCAAIDELLNPPVVVDH